MEKMLLLRTGSKNKYIERLHKPLRLYDSTCNESILNMVGLNKMPKICKLIKSGTHIRFPLCTFEVRCCEIIGFHLCPRNLRTPETRNGNPFNKLLQFITLTIIEARTPDKFLSYDVVISSRAAGIISACCQFD